MELNKVIVQKIQQDMNDAVQLVAKKYGVSIKSSGGKYGELEATLKFKISSVSSDGETQESRNFKMYAEQYGLKSSDLGKEFRMNGEIAKIVGLNIKKRAYPIIVQYVATKKRVIVRAEAVAQFLGYSVSTI